MGKNIRDMPANKLAEYITTAFMRSLERYCEYLIGGVLQLADMLAHPATRDVLLSF